MRLLQSVIYGAALKPSFDHEVAAAGDLNDAFYRSIALARRFLSLAYVDEGPVTAVDVSAIVRRFSRVATRVLGPHIAYSMLAERPAWIMANANEVDQIVRSLVVISRAATQVGGRVALRVSTEQLVAPTAYRHGVVSPGKWVCLCVTDGGRGIAPHTITAVLEDHVTADIENDRGLCLASVLKVVRGWHGHVVHHTRANAETTVTCYFPARR